MNRMDGDYRSGRRGAVVKSTKGGALYCFSYSLVTLLSRALISLLLWPQLGLGLRHTNSSQSTTHVSTDTAEMRNANAGSSTSSKKEHSEARYSR
jgi:hypothetical protein